MMYFSMDFTINKFYFSLGFNVGSSALKIPFTATTETDVLNFKINDRFSYTDVGLIGGYYLIRNKSFHLAPFIFIGGTTISSEMFPMPEDNSREIYAVDGFTYGPGIHTEIKIKEYKSRMGYLYGGNYQTSNYFSLKFDAGYNIISEQKHPEFSGNIAYARIGIVWCFGNF